MKQQLYFIPGMCASSKIFERIQLPKELYKVHLLEWIQPLSKTESLKSYVNRFSKLITENNPIFIGVSFGGIVAQELSKKFNNSKVIIISSIKYHTEVHPFLQWVNKTNLYKLYPVSLINLLEKIIYSFANKKLKRTLITYRLYLPLRNKTYTQWAIQSFLNWQQQPIPLLHLHGDKDAMLPIQYIQNVTVIKGGTHAMILTKSTCISLQIISYLA